jgi:hypothetical protein
VEHHLQEDASKAIEEEDMNVLIYDKDREWNIPYQFIEKMDFVFMDYGDGTMMIVKNRGNGNVGLATKQQCRDLVAEYEAYRNG